MGGIGKPSFPDATRILFGIAQTGITVWSIKGAQSKGGENAVRNGLRQFEER